MAELLRPGRGQPTSHIPVLLLTARGGGGENHGLAAWCSRLSHQALRPRELHLRIRNLLDLQERVRERAAAAHCPRQRLAGRGCDRPGGRKFMQRAVVLIQEHGGESALRPRPWRSGWSQPGPPQPQARRPTGMKTSHFIRAIRLQRAAEMLRRRAGSVARSPTLWGSTTSPTSPPASGSNMASPSEYNEKQPAKSDKGLSHFC